MNRSNTDTTVHAEDATSAVRPTRPASDRGAIAAHPGARITMHLDPYIRAGKFDYRACFSCGAVSQPRPIRHTDTSGRERRCGCCAAEAALPLDVAVKEGWLHVLDAAGRVLNDRVQS